MRAEHGAACFVDDVAATRDLRRSRGVLKQTILRSKSEPTLYFVQRFLEDDAEVTQDECDILFDEVLGADRNPWAFHVTVRVEPGGGPVYERWKIVEGEGQRAARGFIKRTLLRA